MQIRPVLFTLIFQAIFFTPTSGQVSFSSIASQSDWEHAFATAKETGKRVFVDVHAEWCMPCHQMDKVTFSAPAVSAYFNENFVSLKVDGESGFGQVFAEKQAIQAYPTLLFFDENETLVWKEEGFLNADQFLAKGKDISVYENRFSELSQKQEMGQLSLAEKLEYADLLKGRGQTDAASAILSKYLDELPVDDLLPYVEWELVKANVNDFRQPLFQKVIENKTLFIKWRGAEEVRLFIGKIFENGLVTVPMMGSEADMKMLLQSTLPHLDDERNQMDLKKLELDAWLDFYRANEAWDKYLGAVEEYQKANEVDDFFYFEMTRNAIGSEAAPLLSPALGWAKQGHQLNPDLQNSAMLAYALFENKKREEAEALLKKMEADFADDPKTLELIGTFREEFAPQND